MMMNGSHLEDALAVSYLEIADLEHVGRALYNIYYTRQEQNKRTVERIRDSNDHAAEEHRACVAHEHLCGVVIPDEESDASADKYARHERDAENLCI